MKNYKILARHKWVLGATITESFNTQKSTSEKLYRRFTATIREWQNWKIYEGYITKHTAFRVREMVKYIRDCIDREDESIFQHKGYFLK